MAEPLTPRAQPGAIPLLEETAQLLRQAPLATWLLHWTGSVPFGLGLLVFWNNLTSRRLSDQECAAQALGLAVLLVWMNCWRCVFADRLRRRMSAAPDTRWTFRRAAGLAVSQAFLGSAKLVTLPLALAAGFPFAAAVAFFRNASALAGRGDLDTLQLAAKSRALARVHPRQSWAVLPILTLLGSVVAANLAAVYAALPFLVRMLTGYESEFNRGDLFLIQSPLFFVFVLVTAWVAFDPFVQAVYSVRCFHGESMATGEDLRVGVRRIRAARAVPAAVLLLLALVPARAADAVGPKELEQSVRQAMQSPEYSWRIPPPPPTGAASRPWVLRAADKVLEALNTMWKAVGDALGKVLDWIFGRLQNNLTPGEGSAPRTGLHWTVWLLIAAVAAAALWIAWRRRMFSRTAPRAARSVSAPVRLDEEGVTADQLPEERWIEMALDCLRQENYRLALRAYYLASLAWLGQRGFIAIHSGKTNREYVLELRRKARRFDEARGLFGANVAAFEAVWYGMHEVSGDGVAEFRDRLDGMKKVMA